MCIHVWGGGGERAEVTRIGVGTILYNAPYSTRMRMASDYLPQIHALDISTSYLEEREYRTYTHMPIEDNGKAWTRILQYFYRNLS